MWYARVMDNIAVIRWQFPLVRGGIFAKRARQQARVRLGREGITESWGSGGRHCRF